MKLWVDDIRHAPEDYKWCKSVNEVVEVIKKYEELYAETRKDCYRIIVIDLDHDSGDFYRDGGDYIKILDWLEETGRKYPIHIHTMNPVGRNNMLAIVSRNEWKLV